MPVKRIPFAVTIDSRDGTLTKDSKMVNAVPEQDGTMVNLNKRPGLALAYNTLPSGSPTSFTAFKSNLYFTKGNTLYKMDPVFGTITTISTGISTGFINTFVRTYLDKNLFFANSGNWLNSTDGTTFTTVTPPVVSSFWCTGGVWLNNYVYMADAGSNLIYSCHSGDPTSWTSTSNIAFYMTTDTIVGITKHLNYLVAFGNKSMQFYYDAGTGDGSTISSLATAGSYTVEIGCVTMKSVVSTENTVFWAGVTANGGKSFFMLNGVTPVRISTPAIDKVLELMGVNNAIVHKFSGHTMYIVQCGTITLAFDLSTQMWSQWTQVVGGVENQFQSAYYDISFAPSPAGGTVPYVMPLSGTNLYYFSTSTYQDNGQPINIKSLSELDDENNTLMKFVRRAEVIGDLQSTTINLSYTTNDYQTFSTPRVIDMSQNRPQVYQLANGRRRAWLMTHSDNTPLRLEALEIEYELGK